MLSTPPKCRWKLVCHILGWKFCFVSSVSINSTQLEESLAIMLEDSNYLPLPIFLIINLPILTIIILHEHTWYKKQQKSLVKTKWNLIYTSFIFAHSIFWIFISPKSTICVVKACLNLRTHRTQNRNQEQRFIKQKIIKTRKQTWKTKYQTTI